MHRGKILVLFAMLSFTLLSAQAAGALELVTNGGFETGDFTGWTTQAAPSGSVFGVGDNPHSGSYAAYFGAVGTFDDSIYQTNLSTTPGEFYTFSFWLAHNSSNQENDFHALWNGIPVLNINDQNSFAYTEYTFNVQAVGASTTITFMGREVPAYYYLDDVSVSSVPEPSAMLLLGSGLLGLWGARKKFRK